jgi:hypothetical protein
MLTTLQAVLAVEKGYTPAHPLCICRYTLTFTVLSVEMNIPSLSLCWWLKRYK